MNRRYLAFELGSILILAGGVLCWAGTAAATQHCPQAPSNDASPGGACAAYYWSTTATAAFGAGIVLVLAGIGAVIVATTRGRSTSSSRS